MSREFLVGSPAQIVRRVGLCVGLAGVSVAVFLLGGAHAAAPEPISGCAVADISAASGADVAIESASAAMLPGDKPLRLCRITGRIVTRGDGAPPGSARFRLDLPESWNGKLLFNGGSGFDGFVPALVPRQVAQGYATVGTDSGHVARDVYPNPGLDASWVRTSSGAIDTAKIADFAYRARHSVTVAVRGIISSYYRRGIRYAYFMGCSGGGREALIQAQNYPHDFQGYIAGAPSSGPLAGLVTARDLKTFLRSPIPYDKFSAIDSEVHAQCDAADGLKDGLIQNPARCDFNPQLLVRHGILTKAQARALALHLSALHDEAGRAVSPGYSLSGLGDLSGRAAVGGVGPGEAGRLTGLGTFMTNTPATAGRPQPWGTLFRGPVNWMLAYGRIANLTFNDPDMDILGERVIDGRGRARLSAVALSMRRLTSMGVSADRFDPLVGNGSKVLIYHGYSDSISNPYATVAFYRALARKAGGYGKLARSVRLFAVPEMQHCRGGSGPNSFDPLPAMERWAEQGIAPDAIIATKFQGNDEAAHVVERSMPVCPYPAMAHYTGKGSVGEAGNWVCRAGDRSQLRLGTAGIRAGLALGGQR